MSSNTLPLTQLTCPTCTNRYADILDHIRKKHPDATYSALELQPLGLTPCPTCATACKGEHGVKTHSSKVHGAIGSSRVSTLPRTYTTTPALAALPSSGPRTTPLPPRTSTTISRASSLITGSLIAPPIAKSLAKPLTTTSAARSSTTRLPISQSPKTSPPKYFFGQGPALKFPEIDKAHEARVTLRLKLIREKHRARQALDIHRAENRPQPRLPRPQLTSLTPKRKRLAKTPSPGVEPSAIRVRAHVTTPEPKEEEDIYNATPVPQRPPQKPTKLPIASIILPSIEAPTQGPTELRSSPESTPELTHFKIGPVEITSSPELTPIPQPLPKPTTTPRIPSHPPAQRQRPRASAYFTTPIASPQGPSTPQEAQSELAKAHAEAIAPILLKPAIQTLIAYAKVPVPEKRLHPRQAALFTTAAERAAEAFLSQPRERTLLNLLLLPRVLGIGLQQQDLAKTLKAYPTTLPPPPKTQDLETQPPGPPDRPQRQQTPTKRAIKLLEQGYLGRAAQALLDPTPVAKETLATLEALYSKHPIGEGNPFANSNPRPGQAITVDDIEASIASISPEKAPGLSGWTRPLLDLATTSKTSQAFVKALRLLTDMIRQGTAPGQEILCASRLIGLEKKDGGVRPIAVGCMIYRVAFKAILTTSFKASMLLPCQLGVNSLGGAEPIIFMLENAISGPNETEIQRIASLDLTNAFNTISRRAIATSVARYAPTIYRAAKWSYNQPSLLVTHSGATIASAEGARQGDPIAPLLFSLGIRPTLEHLQATLPDTTLAAYLDDIYIFGRNNTLILPQVAQAFKGSPVSLNRQKSTEDTIDTLKSTGLKALGSFLGPLEHRKTFLQAKIDKLTAILDAIRDLPKQYALLLLRGSLHLLLRHLLRQLSPTGLGDLWIVIDTLIEDAIRTLCTRDPQDTTATFQRTMIAIPVRNGGLGIPNHAQLFETLYEAAFRASAPRITKIQPTFAFPHFQSTLSAKETLIAVSDALVRDLQTLPAAYQKARLENTSFLGRQWLRVMPTQKHHLIADPELTEALRTRLLIPCRPIDTACTHCGATPRISHEDVCRGANRRWIARHDQITRAFIKTLSCRSDLQVAGEPESPENNSLRADFSVLIGTSRYYYDVQVVAINKDSARDDPFETLREAANAKRRKYSALGAFFEPLIFSAGGLMEEQSAQAYKGLQKLLGRAKAHWLDNQIALTLTKARAISASSIARRA